MEWKKATPEMIEAFRAVAPGGPGAEEKKMFGYPCAFLGGNMFMGLHGDGFVVRLFPEDREALAVAGGRPFEPMKGRPMREYMVLPRDLYTDEAALRVWTAKAYRFATALPPKPARTKRPSRAIK